MFKKITVVVLLAAMLFCYVGCGKIIDEKYVQGSMLPTDDTGSLPTPYDYGDSYGGGDTGGKMSDYNSGGTSYSGPSTPGGLPVVITAARLVTDYADVKVDILEKVKLKTDGTLDTTNRNYSGDEVLTKNLRMIQGQLKKEQYFKDVCFLVVKVLSNPRREVIKIKLDPGYKGRKVFVYYTDKDGTIKPQNPDTDYLSCILDGKYFEGNVISLNFPDPTGTCICAFGVK